MEYLWAPWRIKYIEKIISSGDESCIFCDKPAENKDAENFILYRSELNFVIMNRFPYNSGHLMVAPYRHVAALDELNGEELNEHYKLVARCSSVLKKIMKPDGFNIGMNIGRVAGAGIDKHIHSHIVSRWNGDTNFMPVIAGTKVVNESLEDTYCKLKGEF
jgi:ATP adenylyltransferase